MSSFSLFCGPRYASESWRWVPAIKPGGSFTEWKKKRQSTRERFRLQSQKAPRLNAQVRHRLLSVETTIMTQDEIESAATSWRSSALFEKLCEKEKLSKGSFPKQFRHLIPRVHHTDGLRSGTLAAN